MRLTLTASDAGVRASCGDARAVVASPPLPDRLWAAALDALTTLLGADAAALDLATDTDHVVLLDVETLGSPAPVLSRADLRALPDRAPHTWALVEAGRYAVLGLDGYLAARLTRGVWLVGLDPVGRGAEVERVVAGEPFGSSDPDCAAGLALPVSLVVSLPAPTDGAPS